MKLFNIPKKLATKLTINQMLVVSHLCLVIILISGFSYSRYHSEWHRHVEYSASIAKLTIAPHIPFLSNAVAGMNYASLTMPESQGAFAAINGLEFLDVVGQSDYINQGVHLRYLRRLGALWRGDVLPAEIDELKQKSQSIMQMLEQTPETNTIRYKKLQYMINRTQNQYDWLVESQSLINTANIPWQKKIDSEQGYYLDPDHYALSIVLPLKNKNGGEVWAVFDASELVNLRNRLIEEVLAEAIVALGISLILIGWVSHWIVSPLKSLAAHMRADHSQSESSALIEMDRDDEIGQLAKAYNGLLTKIQIQLSILRTKSDTDPLTGLGSRHKYSRTTLPFIKSNLAKGYYVGLIICDVDNFKPYNDLYGHTEGDNALAKIGDKLNLLARDSDLAFRYGGEEFVVLYARPELAQLHHFTERLRREVEGLAIPHQGNQPYGVITMSIGSCVAEQNDIYTHYTTHQELLEVMFNTADKTLYKAKLKGRNQALWLTVPIPPKEHPPY